MAKKGVLFKTGKNSSPTPIHKDALQKVTATAREIGGHVELSFTLKFAQASIVESPANITQMAFWPFKEGTQEIDLINPKTQLSQSGTDNPASFRLTVDWPDGKIGGASALIPNMKKK